eukprot:CAMPEP_0118952470 /NCGR_PEP_ID=MMETSP1169-20130426/54908_1 /TAXON_ID=36882 /ORGANISM="Pyramimonas obovata, Strain CCMP722" /LENGTH=150 /DNA_ID=CAMNT_0006899733 /DNA_START=15 /DNA_END=467 /DNA_ORIENTATION=-
MQQEELKKHYSEEFLAQAEVEGRRPPPKFPSYTQMQQRPPPEDHGVPLQVVLSQTPGGEKLGAMLEAISSGYGEELGLLKADPSNPKAERRADMKKIVRLSARNQDRMKVVKDFLNHKTRSVPTPVIVLGILLVSFLSWFFTPPTMDEIV